MGGRTDDGRISVVAAELQLYDRRFASLSADVQEDAPVTRTPAQSHPIV